VVLWLREGARGDRGPWQKEEEEVVRGLPAEETKLRAAGGGEGAVVLWLREAARGGGERRQQEVRGLPAGMIVVCCCMALSKPEPASV
jgi:hypothetical protein